MGSDIKATVHGYLAGQETPFLNQMSPTLDPIPRRFNPFYTFALHFSTVHFLLVSQVVPSVEIFRPQSTFIACRSSHACYISRLSYPPWFNNTNNIGCRTQIMKLLFIYLFASSCYFLSQAPTFPSEFCSPTHPYPSFGRDQVSHLYNKTDKITVWVFYQFGLFSVYISSTATAKKPATLLPAARTGRGKSIIFPWLNRRAPGVKRNGIHAALIRPLSGHFTSADSDE
jgi:hypothetical protein